MYPSEIWLHSDSTSKFWSPWLHHTLLDCALFNFPLLQKLTITSCWHLKWNLEMLAGMPLLKELDCQGNISLTGNINSLRELKDAIEKVNIRHCGNIRGNIMDLADFPRLKELDFHFTAVMGDIRDIREHGFEALESLSLPRSVHGGTSYEFQLISDVPEFMHTIHLLLQRTPTLFKEQSLSRFLLGTLWWLSWLVWLGWLGKSTAPVLLTVYSSGITSWMELVYRRWRWTTFVRDQLARSRAKQRRQRLRNLHWGVAAYWTSRWLLQRLLSTSHWRGVPSSLWNFRIAFETLIVNVKCWCKCSRLRECVSKCLSYI